MIPHLNPGSASNSLHLTYCTTVLYGFTAIYEIIFLRSHEFYFYIVHLISNWEIQFSPPGTAPKEYSIFSIKDSKGIAFLTIFIPPTTIINTFYCIRAEILQHTHASLQEWDQCKRTDIWNGNEHQTISKDDEIEDALLKWLQLASLRVTPVHGPSSSRSKNTCS